jgi:hypothetical protein
VVRRLRSGAGREPPAGEAAGLELIDERGREVAGGDAALAGAVDDRPVATANLVARRLGHHDIAAP